MAWLAVRRALTPRSNPPAEHCCRFAVHWLRPRFTRYWLLACPDGCKSGLENHHANRTQVLVSGETLWMGMGHSQCLARLDGLVHFRRATGRRRVGFAAPPISLF